MKLCVNMLHLMFFGLYLYQSQYGQFVSINNQAARIQVFLSLQTAYKYFGVMKLIA